MASVRRRRCSALLVAASFSLGGCGGDRDAGELVQRDTALLTAGTTELRDAVLAGDRTRALSAVVSFRRVVDSLAPRLRNEEQRTLRTAIRRIERRVRADLPGDPRPAPDPEEADAGPLLPLPGLGEDEKGKPEKPGKGPEKKEKDRE